MLLGYQLHAEFLFGGKTTAPSGTYHAGLGEIPHAPLDDRDRRIPNAAWDVAVVPHPMSINPTDILRD